VIFLKPNSALVGHQQATILPKAAAQFDWEAEAVVVVGDHLDQASVSAASEAIIGWSIANDGTARDLQPIELGGRTIIDWFSAKSIDNSSAIGPAVFPAAAISDPDGMRLRLSRNGEEMQNDVLSLMVVSPSRLLSHISRVVSLRPGDVLLTGTPAGVGKARGIFMDAGDYLEITLEPLGTLTTRIEA
jgi:2-keto-4-pentenoate hydratase/2-oxohepta-3-ene-1,7-dioic acid hydratase in catechol pathway